MAALEQEAAFSVIQDPLRQHALQQLPVESLAHLRRVNRSAQLLVDQQTGYIWKAAASALLDPDFLPDAEHADAVQRILTEQGALLQRLLSGKIPECVYLHAQFADSQRQASCQDSKSKS